MTSFIRRRPQATRDLKDIWQHIATDFEPAADKWAAKVEAICARLADMPRSGRLRTDLGADLRSVPFGNYLIVYRAHDDGIELVRVLHSARDIAALFDAED